MTTQTCPNCQTPHDTSVYVTGQRVLCRCGIRFEVRRSDVTASAMRTKPREDGDLVGTVSLVAVSLPAGGSARSQIQTVRGRPVPVELPTPPASTAVRSPDAEILRRARPDAPPGVDRTFISTSAPVEIDGYELQEVLGIGGMGEVWRGWQKSLGRKVAIKLLPPKLAQDPEFVSRFDKEATALAALSHPNVVQIFDRGTAGEQYYFVMEFVQGRSLREVINAHDLEPLDAIKIVIQIARAIECAHDHQIVHRDLKPENILIDEKGHVKVADFGLAGFRGPLEAPQLTLAKVAMGTLNYMAPEQRRDAKSVDGRADLYSLGVILYELLTGELPLGRFKLPSQRNPAIDARVDEIVLRLLETEPDQRYPAAGEVIAALEAMISTPRSVTSLGPLAQPLMPPSATLAAAASPSTISRGRSGFRVGLMVVGGLALLGIAVKASRPLWRSSSAEVSRSASPPNTNADLSITTAEAMRPDGTLTVNASFSPGGQTLNAHDGMWKVGGGSLVATQAGSETPGQKLVPRAYLAHHYFSSDDFVAEVEMAYQKVDDDDSREEGEQHYSELAFRIKGLQVSAFAIPDVGMRLLWRYVTPDGMEVVGNSALDVEGMVDDEMPVPSAGEHFKVRVELRKYKNGTLVEGFLNGQRFARKVLVGLMGKTGKLALGCRNLRCQFEHLSVAGLGREKPAASELSEGGEPQ